eukprot:578992_1
MAKQSDGLLVITDNKQNDATCTLKSALWDYHPFKKGELKYYTQEFALLDGKWKIQCSGNKEGLNIYFQSVCLPKNSSALGINYHLRLVSRNRTIQTLHSAAFITNNKWIRFDDTIRYTDLGDDLTMTLQMDVTTTYEKGWINWKVCGNLLRHFRSSPDTQYNSAFVTINGVDWLIYTYLTYHPMIKEQTERLTKVTTDQYLLELINHQNQLSKSMKEFAECNVMIKRENELVQQLQDTMQGKLQIEALRVSSRTCVTVIKSYNDFMKNNKQYMDDIRDKFERLWGEFESKWMKWNVEDVISWFKYKTTAMETGTKHDIDWDKTEKQLKSRNISGKALQKFNDLTFEFIGIQDFEVVDHLVCAIKELREKYSKGNKEENVDKTKQIPKEYLCPITKQIMQDPVIAFDGHNYDRNAIESYLKIHQTSPITGATADYLIVFPNHKLKTDISQYVTAHSIDLETQNEANGEGENETAYV